MSGEIIMKNRFLLWAGKILILAAVLTGAFAQAPLHAYAAGSKAEAAYVELEDGEYSVEAALEGGTGRATIASPATLIVREGAAWARIEWSSPKYDYMLVGEEKYLPVNEEGNSVFEIPVTVFDEAMPVIADTTAMSVPHEVEYTLTFYSDSITSKGQSSLPAAAMAVFCVLIIILVCAAVYHIIGKKRKQ